MTSRRPAVPPQIAAFQHQWAARAACRGADPEWFDPKTEATTRVALAICRGCAVRDECRDHALDLPEHYLIWGGLTADQRAALLKARRRTALQERKKATKPRTCERCHTQPPRHDRARLCDACTSPTTLLDPRLAGTP